MEKIEIINLYDKPIVVNIKIAKANSRKISIVGGQLYLTLRNDYKVSDLQKSLMKIFTKKKIESFNSSLY